METVSICLIFSVSLSLELLLSEDELELLELLLELLEPLDESLLDLSSRLSVAAFSADFNDLGFAAFSAVTSLLALAGAGISGSALDIWSELSLSCSGFCLTTYNVHKCK